MKTLSVKQPWADALVYGAKTIEVRSWSTDYRGPVLICEQAETGNASWYDSLALAHCLPYWGRIVGLVDLLECRPMTKADEDAALCNYEVNAYAWVTTPIGTPARSFLELTVSLNLRVVLV